MGILADIPVADASTNSSSSDKPHASEHALDTQKAAKPAKTNGKAVASHAVVSNHTPTSRALQDTAHQKSKNVISQKAEKATKSISSRSSSSDSDTSSSESGANSVKAGQTATQLQNVGATVVADTVSAPTTVRAAKKQRVSGSGNAVATAVAAETYSPAPNQNGKRPRKSNTPFQRIKADAVEFHDDRLKDNGFVARGGSANDYGARANQDLIVTRGDSFRKEKNKKKRGSYRGGEITMQSHSIKFT
ncbi:SRP40, C-terminal domain-containing protein [Gautieria morchelliformis]|nr:SRP40, C-terminal domain-containing protein [Gautieria morchelliformis]